MTTNHAYLPPSGAADWVACAAWPKMQQLHPEEGDSEASAAGTAAHWAGAEMIQGNVVAEGQITPAGTVLDQEMIDSAQVWSLDVANTLARGTTRPVAGSTFGLEQRLAPAFHEQNWGTWDTWYWDTNAVILHGWEFKNGHGIVEVWQNWQLINYTALVAHRLKLPDETRVCLTVVQPRAFHRDGPVRRWHTTIGELRPFFHRLEMAAEDATAPNPTARPSPACTYCSGRHACEALQRDGYRSADLAMASEPLGLTAEQAGTELALLAPALKRLASRVEGLEQQLQRALSKGERSSRWLVERVPGREVWAVNTDTVKGLGLACGVAAVKETPLTPKQLRDAGVPGELLTGLTKRPTSEKLVPFEGSAVSRLFEGGA